jgi:iron(III) transport system substrate-binding protein
MENAISRRNMLQAAGSIGLLAASGTFLAACGSSSKAPSSSTSASNTAVDLNAARNEGTLVVWHSDQEPDNVALLAKFTAKTGIKATEQKISPADGLAKIQLLERTGTRSTDVFLASPDVHHQLQQKDLLMQFAPSELAPYEARFKSDPVGYWCAYFVNVTAITYKPDYVSADQAPKRYEDMLDPQWKGLLEFAGPTSATAFVFWYNLRNILPQDFWDKLTLQRPTAYSSSTAMIQDLNNQNKKIAAQMSVFQVTKAIRNKQRLSFVSDPRGMSTSLSSASIIKSTKRPNAAKAFVQYLLSEEGQDVWNNQIQGSYSPLPNIQPKELPPVSGLKLLVPTDMADYGSTALRAQFETMWSKVVGVA